MTEEYGSNSLPARVVILPTIACLVVAVLLVLLPLGVFFKTLLLVAGIVSFLIFTSIRIDHHLTMEQSDTQ